MIIRFFDWFIDYWVMLNYVFYKFYKQFWKESDPQIRGLIYAPLWVLFNLIEIVFLLDVFFNCRILSTIMETYNYKFLIVFSFFLFFIPNYLLLYCKGKWKDIFKKIDTEREMEEVRRRHRNTVIYICVTMTLFLVFVIVKGLINQFG